jgi:hypothetical protein
MTNIINITEHVGDRRIMSFDTDKIMAHHDRVKAAIFNEDGTKRAKSASDPEGYAAQQVAKALLAKSASPYDTVRQIEAYGALFKQTLAKFDRILKWIAIRDKQAARWGAPMFKRDTDLKGAAIDATLRHRER